MLLQSIINYWLLLYILSIINGFPFWKSNPTIKFEDIKLEQNLIGFSVKIASHWEKNVRHKCSDGVEIKYYCFRILWCNLKTTDVGETAVSPNRIQ